MGVLVTVRRECTLLTTQRWRDASTGVWSLQWWLRTKIEKINRRQPFEKEGKIHQEDKGGKEEVLDA